MVKEEIVKIDPGIIGVFLTVMGLGTVSFGTWLVASIIRIGNILVLLEYRITANEKKLSGQNSELDEEPDAVLPKGNGNIL